MQEPIYLRTHTSLWRVEKKLYKIYDFTLPMPVSLRQVGIFFGFGIPWVLLMKTIGIRFAPPFGHLIWLFPPAILAWWANKPVAEGKRFFEFVGSQVRFFFQQRHFARMRPFRPGQRFAIRFEIWHPGTAPDRAPSARRSPAATHLTQR